MSLDQFDDILDVPYSEDRPTTEETKKTLRRFGDRLRSSVRISTGRIMEDDEFKRARNKMRKKPLP